MTFQEYLQKFIGTPLQIEMANTVEDSPWHREANTWVHTMMVLEKYETMFAPNRPEHENMIARIALLFHDTGKPVAEEERTREDGTVYRRYSGHEPVSARSFMEQYVADEDLRSMLSSQDALAVRFIIEQHLPYGLKDSTKRSNLMAALMHYGVVTTFTDCLISDCYGRISDDHAEKKANVHEWIEEFLKVEPTKMPVEKAGTCFVLVGPSGSGKSTFVQDQREDSDYVLSRDRLYAMFFEEQGGVGGYDEAWKFCCITNKAEFEKYLSMYTSQLFRGSFKSLQAQPFRAVFIDNTNCSRKARARWIQEAKSIGMRIVGVEFWNTRETLIARQSTRGDKCVPASSVMQQFDAQAATWPGSEVHDTILVLP